MANRVVDENVLNFLERLIEITVEAHRPKAIGARDQYAIYGQLTPGRKSWAVQHAEKNAIEVPESFALVPLYISPNTAQRVDETRGTLPVLPPAASPVQAQEDVALLIADKFQELAELFRRMS